MNKDTQNLVSKGERNVRTRPESKLRMALLSKSVKPVLTRAPLVTRAPSFAKHCRAVGAEGKGAAGPPMFWILVNSDESEPS